MDEEFERAEAAAAGARGSEPRRAYSITDVPATGATVLALSGEFDMVAAPALHNRIEAARSSHGLVLDLAGVTFMDSATLKALLRAREDRSARGVRLVLAAVPRPVRRLLDLTGTFELFEHAPDTATAIARLH
jgi:anti-sigma B factor antagonist